MPHRIGRLSLIVAAFCVSSRFLAAQTPSLKGVWEIVEIINTQGQHETAVQPSLYIFTDRHYSIQWVTAPRVVPEAKQLAGQHAIETVRSHHHLSFLGRDDVQGGRAGTSL